MRRRRSFEVIHNPARLILAAYATLILIGTGLLSLPMAVTPGADLATDDALFMATSASTVTGLATVDITTFSLFGELVLLALVQVGGFGIMTIGSLLAVATFRRLGLRQRQLTQAEIGAVEPGQLRGLVIAIAKITLVIEASLAIVLFAGFWIGGYQNAGSAAYSAVFNAITAFNNAGLSNFPDNMVEFVGDPFITLPLTVGFILGGLGFPVFVEVIRRRRRRLDLTIRSARAVPWSLHAKITGLMTMLLLVVGPLVVLSFEWTNPSTLGPLDLGDKLLAGWFQGVTPRTAGFNTINIGAMNPTTLVVISALMFIGAGSASTGGGIKVTTFAVLGAVLWSGLRGDDDTTILRRRLPSALVRQATTIALLSVGVVAVASMALMALDGVQLLPSLFEVTSAFGTTGLTTGITPSLDTLGELVIIVIMLAGRIGPITFVTAITRREFGRAYRYPQERPIIA